MMQYEFEQLAGYEVSMDDYNNIIEPMYMASNLEKSEFVKTINKKRFALKPRKQYIREMKAIAKHLCDISAHYTDYEEQERLRDLAQEFTNRFYPGMHFITHDDKKHYWYCSYICKVEIFVPETGRTIEEIKLV